MIVTTATQNPAVVDLINADARLWTGYSGEQVAGEQAARHLDAVVALLERDGWSRTNSDSGRPDLPDEQTGTAKDMLRFLVRLARFEFGSKPRTLYFALLDVSVSSDGDDDTLKVAKRLLDLVLHARTGYEYADFTCWASKLGRTWPEVKQFLTETAGIARTYGPAH